MPTPVIAASITPRRVPEAHIRAEIGCYPLTSLEAFEQGMICLDPELGEIDPDPALQRTRTNSTLTMWRSCEREFAQHASGFSLDRLVAVRDYTWFARANQRRRRGKAQCIPMHSYLRHLAEAHYLPMYGMTELRRDAEACVSGDAIEAVVHHRWLTIALPEDLLLAALPIEPPPTRVNLGHTLFERRLLDEGVAEVHQHTGAGWDFPLIWAGALAAVANPSFRAQDLCSAGAVFSEGRYLAQWLLVGVIARVVLADFLAFDSNTRGRNGYRFDEFVARRFRYRHNHNWHTLRDALRALTHFPNELPPEFEALRALYAELHPTACDVARDPPETVDDLWRCDPIAVGLDLRNYREGERWLVRHALTYLEKFDDSGRNDDAFARAFWQSLRLRCQFYRYLVERPFTAGLQWFIRFYDRIWPFRRPLDKVQPEASFLISGQNDRVLTALEIRTGASRDPVRLASYIRDLTASWRTTLDRHGGATHQGEELEFGVILTFNKFRDLESRWARGGPKALGARTHAEPKGAPCAVVGAEYDEGGREITSAELSEVVHNVSRLRYGEFLADRLPEAAGTGSLLAEVPELLWVVRGIDVCADELAVPTWALVPLFDYVRHAASFGMARRPDLHLLPLRTTAHVGEDYRHLLEGMRRIYEAVEYLLDSYGGRLGHAIALGVEPQLWAESTGTVLMPKEDRLWDLVFEWRLYTGLNIPKEFVATVPQGRTERLVNLIADLVTQIWPHGLAGKVPTPRQLAQVHDKLHRFMVSNRPMSRGHLERALERGFHRLREESRASEAWVERALLSYLSDPVAFRAGQELTNVTIEASDIEGLRAVQDALRCGIAQRGIVIEVNPTSNLLIGDILDLRQHPLLRLFPIEPDSVSPVLIAIGSDDPITFSTSLAGEYAIMYDTARAAGYPAMVVERWLDRIRRTSLDARFTCSWRPNALDKASQLIASLDEYLLRPKQRPSWQRTPRV